MAQKRKKTRSEIVAERLMNAIVSGEFETGSRLPSETAMAEHFQVSRMTLRQAFKELEKRGAIQARQGSGTYVLYDPNAPQPAEDRHTDRTDLGGAFTFNVNRFQVTQYLDARRAVEFAATDLAVVCMGNENLVRLNEIIEKMYAPDCIPERYAELDCQFHREIVRASQNVFLIQFWAVLEPCLREQVTRVMHGKETFDRSKDMHRQIFNALLHRDRKRIHELLEEHYSTILGRFFLQAAGKGDGPAPGPAAE